MSTTVASPPTTSGVPMNVQMLGGLVVAAAAAFGLMKLHQPAPTPPPPPVFDGKVGPVNMAVQMVPRAPAPLQTATVTLTNPATGKPTTGISKVRARLAPIKLAKPIAPAKAGGTPTPLLAKTTKPGVFALAFAKKQAALVPGTWKLTVSALTDHGHALKKTSTVTIKPA